MKKFFLTHNIPTSFIYAILVHLFLFIAFQFSLPEKIQWQAGFDNKNLITFDLGQISFSPAGNQRKNSHSTFTGKSATRSAQLSNAETSSTTHTNLSQSSNGESLESTPGEGLGESGMGEMGTGNGKSEGMFQNAVVGFKQPQYPAMAIKRNLQGTAIIKLNISGEGILQNVELIQSTNHQILDNAVLDSVKSWRFKAHPKNQNYFLKKTIVFVLK